MQFKDDLDQWSIPRGQTQVPVGSPPAVVPTPANAGQDYVQPFAYETPAYGGPNKPTYNLPKVPTFNAPQFKMPTAADIYNDPSYQFRLSQGLGALEASAAARGNLKTGGHLKDFQNYAQDYASQEWQNAFNRSKEAQDFNYRGAYDAFAPQLAAYQLQFGAAQDAGNRAFDRSYDVWRYGNDDEFRREQLIASLGLPT